MRSIWASCDCCPIAPTRLPGVHQMPADATVKRRPDSGIVEVQRRKNDLRVCSQQHGLRAVPFVAPMVNFGLRRGIFLQHNIVSRNRDLSLDGTDLNVSGRHISDQTLGVVSRFDRSAQLPPEVDFPPSLGAECVRYSYSVCRVMRPGIRL